MPIGGSLDNTQTPAQTAPVIPAAVPVARETFKPRRRTSVAPAGGLARNASPDIMGRTFAGAPNFPPVYVETPPPDGFEYQTIRSTFVSPPVDPLLQGILLAVIGIIIAKVLN